MLDGIELCRRRIGYLVSPSEVFSGLGFGLLLYLASTRLMGDYAGPASAVHVGQRVLDLASGNISLPSIHGPEVQSFNPSFCGGTSVIPAALKSCLLKRLTAC